MNVLTSSQSIVLTGFGETFFENYIDKLQTLNDLMARAISPSPVSPFESDSFHDYASLKVSNRYFTNISNSTGFEEVHFSSDIDPSGALSSLIGKDWNHTTDNHVSYMKFDRLTAKYVI